MAVSKRFLESLKQGLKRADTYKWADGEPGPAPASADAPPPPMSPYDEPMTGDYKTPSGEVVGSGTNILSFLPPQKDKNGKPVKPTTKPPAIQLGYGVPAKDPLAATPEQLERYRHEDDKDRVDRLRYQYLQNIGGLSAGDIPPEEVAQAIAEKRAKEDAATAAANKLGAKDEFVPVDGSEHESSEKKRPAGFSGPSWVGAHEVAAVDPRRQAEMQQALRDQASAVLDAGDIREHGEQVGADAQTLAAKQEMDDLDRIQANQNSRNEYLQRLGGDIEKDSKALAAQKVDPEHYWHSRSTPQSILGIIALALGGFGAAMTGTRNSAADMIEGAIQNDLASQRANLENQWSSLRQRHSVLQDRAKLYGDLDVAEKQQVAARLQGAVMMANAAAARATSPVEVANARALAAQLQQKAVEAGIAMNKWVSAYQSGGPGFGMTSDIKPSTLVKTDQGWVDIGDPEVARQYNTQNMAADNVTNVAQQMIELLNDPMSAVPGSAVRGQLKALGKQVTVEDQRSLGSGSRSSIGMMRYLNSALGTYEDFNPISRAQSREALETFIKKAEEDRQQRNRQLHGNWIVERAVDPAHPNKMQVVGKFDASKSAPKQSSDVVPMAGKITR